MQLVTVSGLESKMLGILFVIVSVLLLSSSCSAQDCTEVLTDDFRNLSAPIGQLLPDFFQLPFVIVLDSNTVCLAQGEVRDRYRYASVVVNILFPEEPINLVHVNLQCTNGVWLLLQPNITSITFETSATTPALKTTQSTAWVRQGMRNG